MSFPNYSLPLLPRSNHYSEFFQHRLVLPVYKFHINGIMQDLPFDQRLLFSIILRVIHVAAYTSIGCLFLFLVILHFINIPQYPFSCWWSPRLFHFWLLWIFGLLWTFLYKSFCGHMFSFLLCKSLDTKLLCQSVGAWLAL